MYHVPLVVQYIYGWSDEGGEVGDGKEGRKWRLPGILYVDDLVLCGELEKDLRAMVGWFAEVCRRRGLKVNPDRSKVIVIGGEEGLDCEVHVDGIRLEHVSELNNWGVFWTNQAQNGQNLVGRWQVGGGLQVPSGP